MVDRAPPNAGRRSERARQAIFDATRQLVGEHGFAKVSIDSIAARAGVGKQTIYRWWPSKCALVLDVLIADNLGDGDASPLPDTGDLAADLSQVLHETVDYFQDPVNDNLLRAMTAEIQYDQHLAVDVLDKLLRPQFDAIANRIRAAGLTTPRGSPADPEIVAEQLVGPILHRWLLRRAPLDGDYIDQLIAHVIGPDIDATTRRGRRSTTSRR